MESFVACVEVKRCILGNRKLFKKKLLQKYEEMLFGYIRSKILSVQRGVESTRERRTLTFVAVTSGNTQGGAIRHKMSQSLNALSLLESEKHSPRTQHLDARNSNSSKVINTQVVIEHARSDETLTA